MTTKVYVGNLPFSIDDARLSELFGQAGGVTSVVMPTDMETGRKRGFAFVEYESDDEAQEAIRQFNGATMEGRQIVVNAARVKEHRPREGGGRSNFSGSNRY